MTDNDLPNTARRRFLAQVTAVSVGLGSGLTVVDLADARRPDEPANASKRWGMLIDSAKCATDCDACVTACNEEHGLSPRHGPATDAQWIRKVHLRDNTTGRESVLPVACQHCESAPCVDVCPTGASFRRPDGIVLVDKHSCIGCRYCMMACPFKARSFVHENLDGQKSYSPRGKGTVESCTLCVHRIDGEGNRRPACVEACSEAGHGALVFGDLNDPHSPVARAMSSGPSTELRPDLHLSTGVRYQNF